MANINRDYLVVLDVKSGSINAPTMKFMNTDKATSNIYVQLVIKQTVIVATPIQNATDFVVKANIIKNGNIAKLLVGELVNEVDAIYEFDLPSDCTDLSGDYLLEFVVSAAVDGAEESITSTSTTYTVGKSILTGLDSSIEDSSDYPILQKLIDDVRELQANGGGGTGTGSSGHTHSNKAVLDGITSTKVNHWDTAYTHSQTAHFSGDYNDLTNKPTIPEASGTYVHPDTHPASMITGLANVATSGSYTDLTNTPTIPTNTSDLTNNSGFATETYVTNAIANAQLGGGGGSVDLSGYVTKEVGNASQITFSDGQTFQAKLDAGTLKGEKGDTGATGATGPQGEKGDKGDTGLQGLQGPQGIQGEVGPQGPQGEQGPAGKDGAQGPQGEKGADGYTPVKGVDYFDGAKGDKGDKGDIGETGPQGPQGLQGIQGERGPQGEQGPAGANGQDGLTTAISVNGTTYTHSNGTITLPNYPTVVSAANGITIEDTAGNFTATNVEGALAELFQNVSNGKTLIASAITDMGVDTSNTDTFEQMAINIRNINVQSRIPCTSITLDKDTLELSMSSSQVNLLDGVSHTESGGDYNFSVTLEPGNYVLTNINGGNFTYLGVKGIGENLNVTEPYAFTITEKATYTIKCEPHGDTIDKIALYKEGLTSGSQSYQLTATVLPANCTDPVVWSVSPEGVATVTDGLVTLIADGTCTVTATCGDKSATCVVNPINSSSSYPSQFASAIYDISNNLQHWTVFGDSISTTYNISENEIWHNLITADSEFPNITKVNNSLTGSEVSDGGRTIDSFVERYTNLPTNTNLITIFAGVNDWAHNNIPLGNYDDTTTNQSFYGALNTLLPGMKNKCPNARIIWLSPLKTKSNMAVEHTNTDGTNTLGLYLTDYIQAIKYKCHQYNVEFVDLYGVTGLEPDVDTGNFQSDGLHPNANGQAALRDYLLNVATVSVPTDEYINEIGTDVKFPAVATFNNLVNRNTAYFCVVVDVSSLKNGDSVVASWTGSEASVWNNNFNNSADPWYCTESELRNVSSVNDSRVKASGSLTKLTGDLLSGTSTTIITSPGADYKYLRIQVPINNPHLPGTWTISNMTVTVNGTTNLPILNIGGFFVNSDIVITH